MSIVAFDGPTGVGKSTAARAVAERLGGTLLLDPVSVSPLLGGYYNGRAVPSAILDDELTFLRGRARLLSTHEDRLVVADFTVARTGPFAEFLSDPDERASVIDEMRRLLAEGPSVDLLVLLDADAHTLLRRVHLRNRRTEGDLTIEHLTELRHHFGTWRSELLGQANAVIEIDTTRQDVRRLESLDDLAARIATMLPL